MGARIAELLKVGFVSSVVEFETNGSVVTAKQETEEGYVKYETVLPAVFTVAKPGYEPRYPNIRAKMTARKAVVPVFTASDIGAEAVSPITKCVAYQEPAKRSGGLLIREADMEEAVKQTMSVLAKDMVL